LGVYAAGPVDQYDEVVTGLRRAVQWVKEEQRPALLDVLTAK